MPDATSGGAAPGLAQQIAAIDPSVIQQYGAAALGGYIPGAGAGSSAQQIVDATRAPSFNTPHYFNYGPGSAISPQQGSGMPGQGIPVPGPQQRQGQRPPTPTTPNIHPALLSRLLGSGAVNSGLYSNATQQPPGLGFRTPGSTPMGGGAPMGGGGQFNPQLLQMLMNPQIMQALQGLIQRGGMGGGANLGQAMPY